MAWKVFQFLFVCAFGQFTYALINGTNITNGQFAAHVLLTLPNRGMCGGEIIDSNHVLTACSCVFNEYNELFAPGDVTVLGKWNITTSPLTPELLDIGVVAIYAHPEYDPYSKENDIAVLRLSRKLLLDVGISLPSITNANLAVRITADKTGCSLAGFIENSPSAGLMFQRQSIYNRIECNQNEKYSFRIKNGMICAAPIQGAICKSDRGSGLYCNGYLTGLLSFGTDCNNSDPSVYTQIRMYGHWIKEQLWRTDVPPAGPTPPPSNKSGALDQSVFFYLFYIVVTMHWLAMNFVRCIR